MRECAMNILLVQKSFPGDAVLATPLFAAINAAYPAAKLWFLTTPGIAPLIERDPLLAGVLTYERNGADRGIAGIFRITKRIRELKFDIVFSLQRSPRMALILWLAGVRERIGVRGGWLSFLYHERRDRVGAHDVERNLSILGAELLKNRGVDELRLFPPPAEELSVLVRENIQSSEPYIVIVPGSAWYTKRWYWERFREVADHWRRTIKVIVVGTKSEHPLCDQIACGLDNVLNLAGQTTLGDVLALIKNAEIVISNDSSSLHIASACKTPTVAIFCATSPSFGFGPWRNRAVVVEKQDLHCKPCSRHGTAKCPTGTEACMRELPAAEVIGAANSLIGRS